jgi:hypothetical protein
MKNLLSERIASTGLLIILSCNLFFHVLVMVGVVPFEIVWGGRLKNHSEMLSFETVSILINLLMLAFVCIQAGLLKISFNRTALKIILWSMAGIFAINTVGNLFSNNEFEKMMFTPLTLLLSIFFIRLAIVKEAKVDNPN